MIGGEIVRMAVENSDMGGRLGKACPGSDIIQLGQPCPSPFICIIYATDRASLQRGQNNGEINLLSETGLKLRSMWHTCTQSMDPHIDFDFTAAPIDAATAATWIGKGRKFPSHPEAPASLLKYCQDRLKIPGACRLQLLPDKHLTVDQFLKLHLPPLSNDLVGFESKRWFSCEPPNEDHTSLKWRTIPPKAQVAQLKQAFSQAILDGAQSISDPRYSTSRLPLFAVQFWLEMSDVHNLLKEWQDSSLWVCTLQEKETSSAVDEAGQRLRSLPWKGVVKGSKRSEDLSISALTRLLGVRWINGDLIDAMIQNLQSRLRVDPSLHARIMITNSLLAQQITDAKSRTDFDHPPNWLVRLEENIRCQEQGPTLYFPAHVVAQKHWICFRLDFEKRTISYGMPSALWSLKMLIVSYQVIRLPNVFRSPPIYFANCSGGSQNDLGPVSQKTMQWYI